MKRFLALILCLAALLCLFGCKAQGPDETEPAGETQTTPSSSEPRPSGSVTLPTETTVPQETIPSYDQKLPFNAISMPPVTEDTLASDGTVLFQRTYQQNISFTTEDTEISQKVVLDLLNRIDSGSQLADDLIAAANNDYNGTDEWVTYFVNTTYNPVRLDRSVLSLYGSEVSFGGGLHSAYTPVSVNYDLLTGEALNIQDILSDDYNASTICDLIVEALAPHAETGELFGDYELVIRDIFEGEWLDMTAWYLSEEGLCFYFAPYEIGPYASGTMVAEIPYSKLPGILQDAYFPAEAAYADGEIKASLLSQADASSIKQFAEVTMDESGEQILLYTDGVVTNVRIDYGMWDMDGVDFLPEATVFAADTMTADEAILLTTYIPDVMSNLRLTYNSGEAETVVYISQSGMDGSILLLDN